MSEKEQPKPKVIRLDTREEFKPLPTFRGEEVEDFKPGAVDERTVKALDEALEMAKTGELTGFVAIGWDPLAKEFWRHVTIPKIDGLQERNAAAMMVGGLSMLSEDMRDRAFWTQGYDPLVIENEPLPPQDEDEDDDPELGA